MKYIGKLLGWILLGVNGIVVLFLLLAAYSPYLHPQDYPILSCFGLAFPIFLCFNLLFFFFWLIVYRKYTLLPILAVVCCWDAVRTYVPVNLFNDEKSEATLKFLSYNTMAFGNREAHTKEKPNKILKYLSESDADIICLQECVWGDRLKKKDVDYALRKYKYKHHYSFANGLNGLGVYSRTHIHDTHVSEEITLGAAFRPIRCLHLAASYSFFNGCGSNIGAAISVAPYDGVMLTAIADYIPLSFAEHLVNE